MPALKVTDLYKQFGAKTAVDHLDFSVPEGSLFGFLGPNGAGKTTTIRMLTGIMRPDAGEIGLFGKSARFGPAYPYAWIGFLPDVPEFYGWMNAFEFLNLCSQISNMKNSKNEITQILEKTGLPATGKRIRSYSRGMKQRLGIAQALLHRPRILFLDEPTSALDPIGRKEILDLMLELRQYHTLFFSTHILSDAERVCDRILIIKEGKKILEGETEKIKESYRSNSMALQVNPENSHQAESLLKGLEVVKQIKQTASGAFQVQVNDKRKASILIPQTLTGNQVGLNELIWVEPTLEDIFVKAVNE